MDHSSFPGITSGSDVIDAGTKWIHCPSCEALCRDRLLSKHMELRCRRCGARVKVSRGTYSLQPAFAFSTAGLFAAILANINPIMTFDVVGDSQSGWIITGVEKLYEQGYWPLAALVLFASIMAPILYLAAVWYVSAACLLKLPLPTSRKALPCIGILEPWNLIPVYAIATVVSVVKLKMLGDVHWELGARWVLGMALCSLLASQSFDYEIVREKLLALRKI